MNKCGKLLDFPSNNMNLINIIKEPIKVGNFLGFPNPSLMCEDMGKMYFTLIICWLNGKYHLERI